MHDFGADGRVPREMAETKPSSNRDERLAARLRENLKRRKAQARALDKIGRGLDPGEAESADSLESGLSKSAG